MFSVNEIMLRDKGEKIVAVKYRNTHKHLAVFTHVMTYLAAN